MFCSNCGKENPNDARFCNYCGSALIKQAEPEIVTGETQTDEKPIKPKKKMSGDTIVLIILLVIVIGGCIVLATWLFSHKSKGKEASSETTVSEEIVEVSSEDISTENEEPGEPILTDPCKLAYEDTLVGLRYYIYKYYWQFDYEEGLYGGEVLNDNPVIALRDITGDRIPELFIVYYDEYKYDQAQMEVYTYSDALGQAELLFQQALPGDASGLCHFCLFENENGEIYFCTSSADQDAIETYSKLVYKDKTILVESELSCQSGSDSEEKYEEDGKTLTKEEFQTKYDSIVKGPITALLYDKGIDETGKTLSWQQEAERVAVTYPEAIRELTVNADVTENEIPILDTLSMISSSGAGAWQTEIWIDPDGNFYLDFYDWDMGDFGDDYPEGTCYICKGNGKLSVIQKISDNIYYMKVESFKTETEVGEWIEDGVRYVGEESAGINSGDTLYFYLPGISSDALDKDYVRKVNGASTLKNALGSFGMYDIDTGAFFFNSDYEKMPEN